MCLDIRIEAEGMHELQLRSTDMNRHLLDPVLPRWDELQERK